MNWKVRIETWPVLRQLHLVNLLPTPRSLLLRAGELSLPEHTELVLDESLSPDVALAVSSRLLDRSSCP